MGRADISCVSMSFLIVVEVNFLNVATEKELDQ